MPNPDAVYDVLVREAGASESYRQEFRDLMAGEPRSVVVPRRAVTYFPSTNRVVHHYMDDIFKPFINRTNAALAALEGGDD